MDQSHAVVDATVIEAAKQGDRDAVQELWRTYQPQVLRFLTASQASAPEDIASQVWIDVSRTIDRFVGDGVAFQRWIFTIAKRRSIDETRRVTRRREVLDDHRTAQADRSGGVDLADRAGSLEWALATVRRLPTDMAEAVMLRAVYDLPTSDVAQLMGRTEGNVRVLVHRGLQRLNELLAVDAEVETEPSEVRQDLATL